jgi:hypothetical protein
MTVGVGGATHEADAAEGNDQDGNVAKLAHVISGESEWVRSVPDRLLTVTGD